jgi:hypothetical protein
VLWVLCVKVGKGETGVHRRVRRDAKMTGENVEVKTNAVRLTLLRGD